MSEENANQDNLDTETSVADVEIPEQFKNSDGSTNVDALAKSYADAQKGMNGAFAERDNYKKELDAQKVTATLAEGIEKIVANTTPAEKVEPSFDEYMAGKASELAEEMGLEPDDPAVKMAVKLNSEAAKATSSWMKDSEKALKEQYDSKFEALETRFTADKSDRVKSTPEYVANKAEIDGLTGAGMDEGKAIQYVLTKSANTSDTSTPPPSTVNGRVTAEAVTNDYWTTPADREEMVRFKGGGAEGEARVLAMEATGAKRMGGE